MKPYDTEQDKKEQVREMFDRIAPAYDRLNHTLSFQIDKLWRRHVVRIVRRMQPRRILDVATGTGDLALAMARRMRGVQVLGVDLSENMLAEARRKATACGLDERVVLSLGDAERLEVADASVDVVTVAFGVRNFGDLGAGLREIARVLKPGGTFCGCFYVKGEQKRTEWFVRHVYEKTGFFTPPYETAFSLKKRLEKRYATVTLGTVKSMAWFACRKAE